MSRGEKKLKTIVYIGWILALVVLCALSCCSCAIGREVEYEEDPFPNFRVYDYHLRFLRSDGHLGVWESDDYFHHRYYPIDGFDTTECVGLYVERITIPGSGGGFYVLQSVIEPVDILREWNVSSIEFFFEPQHFYRNRNGSAVDQAVIHYSTENRDVYTELLALLNSQEKVYSSDIGDYSQEWLEKYVVLEEDRALLEQLDSRKLYMRIVFEESNNIVWETSFTFSARENYLKVDVGSEMTEHQPNWQFCLIEPNSDLYRAIIAALDAYAAE